MTSMVVCPRPTLTAFAGGSANGTFHDSRNCRLLCQGTKDSVSVHLSALDTLFLPNDLQYLDVSCPRRVAIRKWRAFVREAHFDSLSSLPRTLDVSPGCQNVAAADQDESPIPGDRSGLCQFRGIRDSDRLGEHCSLFCGGLTVLIFLLGLLGGKWFAARLSVSVIPRRKSMHWKEVYLYLRG